MPEPVVKANGCHSPREGSMVSKCLKAIEVKYQEDGVLDKLLTILNTYGVSSDVVTIQKKDSLSSESKLSINVICCYYICRIWLCCLLNLNVYPWKDRQHKSSSSVPC